MFMAVMLLAHVMAIYHTSEARDTVMMMLHHSFDTGSSHQTTNAAHRVRLLITTADDTRHWTPANKLFC